MKLCLILVACLLATLTPSTHALLGAKLALLGLGGNLLGGGSSGGGSSGGSYGNGGYGSGGYNGGYYGQGGRPVYNGNYGNGYGYGGGYNYGRGYSGSGYSNGDVRVIKVIVDNQNVGASDYSNSGWTPIPAPVQTTYVAAPVPRPVVQVLPQPIQYTAAGSTQAYQYRATDQGTEVNAAAPATSASSEVSVNLQPPEQQPPQPIVQSVPAVSYAPSQSAQVVKTVRLIVDGSGNNQVGYNGGVPSQSYGPPPVQSAWGGWNNGYKSGGIWEKLGC